ncbi:LOW QUALITY PROTEIN: IQ domain-containing protein N [Lemur catta]|uniref:LOW QUALITY PROTEIN: IQ domain-containing protein N n=1 Tax=Lemur catta TaxID=9447 RepID=UPI001E2697D5|nr:LOW QUALITY PROTEIN: IQ domain-containing protein N [Lemur catta]
MTLQGNADLLRNRDDAASSTATAPKPAATRWAVLPPAPARPGLQDNLGKGSPQPQHGPQKDKERLSQQLAEAKMAPRRIPRLRAVVESQAFKNILVDEMDMMLSRAATLIQANWRRYRLRQKLISQVTAAKAIQEAWRRFSMRHLLRSSRLMVKKVAAEEGDIPYHAPQQVRFQHQEENRPLCGRRMVSKETQFPSSDSLAPSTPRPAPLPQPPEPVCRATPQVPGVAFLPHQTVAIRFPCPVSLDTKCQPCLLTETVRSACLIHIEGDTVKTKHVTARTNKGGCPEPPPSGNSQAVTRPLKIQTQACVETETFKGPLQICPGPVITKTLPQTCPVVPIPKTPPQTYSVPVMTKTPPKTSPVPTIVMTKTPPQVSITKTPAQICPGPTAMTKTQGPVRPTASVTSTLPQPCPVAKMAKIPPQACLLASTFKPLPQTRHMAMMAKTPPQVHLATTTAKSSLQTSLVATTSKTSSQTCPVTSITKPPAQMRLAAMLTKTPAQVATVLRTLCLAPPTAGTLKAPPQAAAGILNTSSPIHLNTPKAKAATNMKQATGAARVSPHSYLADRKAKCFPQPHPGAAAPKAMDKPLLEAERIRAGPPRLGNADTASKTSVAMGMTRAMSWTKVVEEGNKDSLQAHLRTEVVKVQSQVYVPVEMAVTLPQGQPATLPTKALCHEPPPCVSQGQPATSPTKASSQLHLPTKMTKAPSLAHLVTCLSRVHSQSHLATGAMKFQSQVHLPTGLMKAQSQAQLVTDTAKCLFTAHQAADLTSKTQSQPLLAGPKASTQPCQHLGVLSAPPRAKPEDRLTQLQPHSHALSKTSQGPHPVSPESQGMLVPMLASTVQPTCNIESWGDSGAERAQPSLPSQAAPCQEDVAASQLASLCTELAAVLGSQEDLRVLLAKALSQGEVRAALNQALSKEVLGATVAKALPQGLLGMVLVKALSWSELGVTLSRALSRGELRAELTKAMQGKLAEVLGKALTDEERAALSQALCQGELGAVLSQSLSQVALRTGAILPKAASKTAGSGMTVTPAPVVVDCRESLSVSCGPALGLVRTRCSKGPVDAGVAGGQSWNSAVPSVVVKPTSCAVAPRGVWEPARDPAPWETVCSQAAVDPRLSPELMVSMQTVEAILIRAVITIQAGTRGYLVRRTIRMWHVMATVIQTYWRGYRVRRNLARLYRAITLIQAAWRGYCTRRDNSRRRQMLLPVTWGGLHPRSVAASPQPCFQDLAARATSDHRCFQSCQPGVCSLCQSLSSGLGSPPSVVMLVGSNPRTCHMCGHTQLRRVVQGTGRGAPGHGSTLWSPVSHLVPQNPRQLHRQNKAATSIQSAWRGFRIRRQMTEQQKAAKMVQATWRGHYTRNCLTTDALLGRTSPWAGSRHLHSRWPGV